jgi:hypothetical protein
MISARTLARFCFTFSGIILAYLFVLPDSYTIDTFGSQDFTSSQLAKFIFGVLVKMGAIGCPTSLSIYANHFHRLPF